MKESIDEIYLSLFYLSSGEGEGSCSCVHGDLGKSAIVCVGPYNYVHKVKKIVSVKA